MVHINLIGSIFGSSGYVSHTRQLFNALYEQNPDIHLETNLPTGWELLVNDAELNAITKPYFDDGVTIMIGMPPFWNLGKNNPCKRFYGFAVWEGDKVPKSWVDHMKYMHRIFVPSTHVKDAIANTFAERGMDISSRIRIIPHGVDTTLFQPKETPKGDDEPFVFLANKGWAQGENDRGGLQYVFRAFAEEFGKDEPVQLRVKINTAYCPPGWNLGEELKKLGLPDDRPQFFISVDTVDYKSMPLLYDGDVFVNPTMGEAFSIPCAEAMAMGVPVITTAFGGQTDYVNEENGWLVPYDLFEVDHDIMYEGVRWGRPRLEELKKLLRYVYEHRDEVRQKGDRARQDILSWTWRESAIKLLSVINNDLEAE